MERSEREILIWLSHLGGITYHEMISLTQYFGSLSELWDADQQHLEKALGKHRIIVERMKKNNHDAFIEGMYQGLGKYQVEPVTILDEEYPEKLKGIYDPPTVIYMKGKPRFDQPMIGIVGSRRATPYGKWAANFFAKELAKNQVGIISGLALGIDTAAHKGALEGEGYTVGVLACGLDQCYPASNRGLRDQILVSGCLISEYSPQTPPLKHHFPARNRIISGLSDGIVVIEAAEKSGALHTVDFAVDQGKEVYALPGNINQPQSKGTNQLIRDGVRILLSPEELLEDLSKLYPHFKPKAGEDHLELSPLEARIYEELRNGPLHIDMLVYLTKMKIQELHPILTVLELKGVISQLPGKIFTVN